MNAEVHVRYLHCGDSAVAVEFGETADIAIGIEIMHTLKSAQRILLNLFIHFSFQDLPAKNFITFLSQAVPFENTNGVTG